MSKTVYLYYKKKGDYTGSYEPYDFNNTTDRQKLLELSKNRQLFLCDDIKTLFNIGCDKFKNINIDNIIHEIDSSHKSEIYLATTNYMQKYHKEAFEKALAQISTLSTTIVPSTQPIVSLGSSEEKLPLDQLLDNINNIFDRKNRLSPML